MKKLNSAYIGYYGEDNSELGFKIKTFRNINAKNSYTIGYVHHVSRAFNFLLGRAAYFSQRYNKPVREVIITGKDLAKNIGCHPSHSSYVLNTLKELFGLEYVRKNNSHGARTIKLNKRIIDFLKVYSEEDLQAYIMEYDLFENESTLRRLYDRRIWETPDSQLEQEEIKAKKQFLDQKEIKNYHHYTYTSNRTDQKRIRFIEKAQNRLSEIEQEQLKRVKRAEETGSKLEYYLHKVLLKLEQKVSYILNHIHKQEIIEETGSTAIIEGNTKRKGSESYLAATRHAQRLPQGSEEDSISFNEAIKFVMLWNDQANEQGLDKIKELSLNRYNSLNNLCRNTTKGDLFKALSNIKKLYHDQSRYQYKLTLKRFTDLETYKKILETNAYDSRIETTLDSWEEGFYYMQNTRRIENMIPELKTIQEANTWLKSNTK